MQEVNEKTFQITKKNNCQLRILQKANLPINVEDKIVILK